MLGKHKTCHTGEGQSTPHPHLLKVRFIAQAAPTAELHTGHPSLGWEMFYSSFYPSFYPSDPKQLQQQRVTISPQHNRFLGNLGDSPAFQARIQMIFSPISMNQHVSSANQFNKIKMPLPDSSSSSGVCPALPQQFL